MRLSLVLLLVTLSALPVVLKYALYPTAHDVRFRLDRKWTSQRRGVGGSCERLGLVPQPYLELDEDFHVNASIEMLHTKLDLFFKQNPGIEGQSDYETSGMSLRALVRAVKRWRDKYDWRERMRRFEKAMGDQFVVCVDGLRTHYFHRRATSPTTSSATTRPVVLLLHGWPGSFTEFQNLVPLLVNRGYDVITPSLPNFGFSDKVENLGFNIVDAAVLFTRMMKQIITHSKRRYICQGGDYGSLICSAMAQLSHQQQRLPLEPSSSSSSLLAGVHLNMAVVLMPPLSQGASLSYFIKSYIYTEDEKDRSERFGPTLPAFFQRILRDTGYFHEQATKPNTVGIGLNDSPVFLASWILDKFSGWGSKFDEDELLDNLMVYWISQTGVSSCSYYQNLMEDWEGRLLL